MELSLIYQAEQMSNGIRRQMGGTSRESWPDRVYSTLPDPPLPGLPALLVFTLLFILCAWTSFSVSSADLALAYGLRARLGGTTR